MVQVVVPVIYKEVIYSIITGGLEPFSTFNEGTINLPLRLSLYDLLKGDFGPFTPSTLTQTIAPVGNSVNPSKSSYRHGSAGVR